MLENFHWPKLEDSIQFSLSDEHEAENVWFQQDGAAAHTSRRLLGTLGEMFPGHVVSLRGDIRWPLLSPDLTPCDFILWGYLKAQVYRYRSRTLEGLEEAITQEAAGILPEMTRRIMEKDRERLNQCIENEGRHLSEVVFKSSLQP
jgi:hypothetical protein